MAHEHNDEDMDPTVAFLTNDECPTCVYRERYRKLDSMESKLAELYAEDDEEQYDAIDYLEGLVEQEKQDLLDFGNYIAEKTCTQMKVAAHALWN